MTTTTSTQFKSFLAELNPAQYKAATTTEGPVLVVAGPGTGKTQVLVARIAYILQHTDTKPSSVLALTFTDSAAKNMRERLVKLIGTTAYGVQISTFHAFCREVIAAHPEYFPLARGSEAISDLERYELLQTAIVTLPLKRLRPVGDPFCFLTDIISAISDLKREGVSVERFTSLAATLGKDAEALRAEWETQTAGGTKRVKGAPSKKMVADALKEAEKTAELAQIYEYFQTHLALTKRFDFDDMISLVVAAFREHEELLLDYQENIHYFLVDEYQDTNSAQDALLDVLASYWQEAANVFVVGDPNQAIYRFQGASVENMLGFVDRYPHAEIITLDQAYRCPQSFYDSATRLITNNHLQLSNPAFSLSPQLQSHNQAKTPIIFAEVATQQLEAVWVTEQIQHLLESGVEASKIAVLYRNNADRTDIATTLSKWNIRYAVEGGTDVLEVDTIRQLLTFFTALSQLRTDNPGEALFQSLLFSWSGVDSLTVMQFARLASQSKKSLVEIIELPMAELQKIGDFGAVVAESAAQAIKNRYQLMVNWSALDAELVFTEWFERVIAESGFLASLQTRVDQAEQLVVLHTLFEQIKGMNQANHALKLTNFLDLITTFQTHHLSMRAQDQHLRTDAVCLSTVHKAKGREWDHVFVIGLVHKKWGDSTDRSKLRLPADLLLHTQLMGKDQNEDDRRLFYVAITRARQTLWLSRPERIVTASRSDERIASQFITELGNEYLQTQATTSLVDKTDEYLARLLAPAPLVVSKEAEYEERQRAYFARLIANFQVSVTALNTYLKDPVEFVMNNLLRIPRAKPEPMAFGSAIHTALEHHYRQMMVHKAFPDSSETISLFENALAREVLTPDAYQRRLAHGREILQAYLQSNRALVPVVELEKKFGTRTQPVMLGDISLSGRIDRIDWADENHKSVIVIDYKTGKPKTNNEIAGLTKNSELSEREATLPESIRGNYKRQLLFYKLLAKQDKNFRYEVASGRFEFIEPDRQSQKLIVREFELPDQEVEELAELIRQVMKELRSLEFLPLLTAALATN